jgi:hypothetical protein
VRDLSYNFYVNIYTGTDMTVLSNHLFADRTLREWAYAEEPYKIVWAVRDDGILLGYTYMKDQEVYAWTRHDTQGPAPTTRSATCSGSGSRRPDAPDAAYEAMLRDDGKLDLGANSDQIARRVEDARQDLMLKTHAWLHDTADRSIVTPGAADRSYIARAGAPGTFWGEFARFVAQFKMWPIAAIRQQWGRDLYGTPGDTMGKVGGIMNLTVGSMVAGYAIMTLKDLLKGQNPRPPLSPLTAAAAMMQGGGIGILGDYLFGEYSRFGQNAAETALGPVLGQGLSNVMDLWNRIKARAEGTESANMRDHPVRDIGPDMLKLVTDNLPFANLWYTRQALNYLFFA